MYCRQESILIERELTNVPLSFLCSNVFIPLRFPCSGSVVVDVGCAPGSWCQVANEFVNQHKYDNNDDGYVLGIDLQPILPLSGVDLIQLADVRSPKTHRMIKERLKDRSVDVVLSDMAPNPSGDKALDHDRIVSLCEELIRLCCDSATNNDDKPIIPLKRGGTLLCKIWDGQRKSELIELLKTKFTNVANIKPNASRDHSAELYLLARNRK
ncbi:unnamed protein product [Anisakis simplex]|uniref:rRNA methyltransferase 2, mitochondrial n=1 Tax=Anisakis simplex TaxID=6269 RepID=A0A0M3K8F4_ANISI|nr:unnamed protein product [Anisakis simplex]